jgi:biopolymer transport protein ExbD
MDVGRSTTAVKSEINVTPLVDVVLVLLIIFMVITPLLQMGYTVDTPPEVETSAPPPTMSDQLIVRMDKDGRMFINKDTFGNQQDFARRLTEAIRNREAKIVFFAADGDLEYDKVADFMDLVRDAGAKNLGIVFEDLRATPAAASAVGITGP